MAEGLKRALELAAAGRGRSVAALADLVRVPSLTGEEGAAQQHLAQRLGAIGAEVDLTEPDVPAMFARFPAVAQYPTHWQHDLILPYDRLPTAAALTASGLEDVLNYRGRPNLVGILRGTGGGHPVERRLGKRPRLRVGIDHRAVRVVGKLNAFSFEVGETVIDVPAVEVGPAGHDIWLVGEVAGRRRKVEDFLPGGDDAIGEQRRKQFG